MNDYSSRNDVRELIERIKITGGENPVELLESELKRLPMHVTIKIWLTYEEYRETIEKRLESLETVVLDLRNVVRTNDEFVQYLFVIGKYATHAKRAFVRLPDDGTLFERTSQDNVMKHRRLTFGDAMESIVWFTALRGEREDMSTEMGDYEMQIDVWIRGAVEHSTTKNLRTVQSDALMYVEIGKTLKLLTSSPPVDVFVSLQTYCTSIDSAVDSAVDGGPSKTGIIAYKERTLGIDVSFPDERYVTRGWSHDGYRFRQAGYSYVKTNGIDTSAFEKESSSWIRFVKKETNEPLTWDEISSMRSSSGM